MNRPFLIERIQFDDVSGEVRGRVQMDRGDGAIDDVFYESFLFRGDESDRPIVLDPTQTAIARSIVERVLDDEPAMVSSSGRVVASGAAYPPVDL